MPSRDKSTVVKELGETKDITMCDNIYVEELKTIYLSSEDSSAPASSLSD